MAPPTVTPMADLLLARAETGEKLDTDSRRHVVAWLLADGSYTNVEMARKLNVDEKTIRKDLQIVKASMVEDIRETTDVKMVIADLCAARDLALAEIEKLKKKLRATNKDNTPLMLRAIEASVAIHTRVTQQLQDMGWIPKTLGTVTHRHHFRAVQQKGNVETRRVDLFDDIRPDETLEDKLRREAATQKALVDGTEIIEAEFEDLPVEGNDQSATSESIDQEDAHAVGPFAGSDPGATSSTLGTAEPPHQRVEAAVRPEDRPEQS